MVRRRRHEVDEDAEVRQVEMHVEEIRRGDRAAEGYEPINLGTSRGEIAMRLYAVPEGQETVGGVICVGGAGGGWDSPVKGGLYPWLAKELPQRGVAVLRVRFRDSHDLEEATLDVLAGVEVLASEGVERVGVVGHSFGGAVVIGAAASDKRVVACATLASQSFGAEPAAGLGPRCALLLLHGAVDTVLPPWCSEHIHRIASEPKDLRIHPHANHGLDEWEHELPELLRDWLLARLPGEPT